MIVDPASAPPRTDLPFLQHRSRPKASPVDTALADFIHGRARKPSRHPAPEATAPPTAAPARSAPPVSFDRPGRSTGSLDLSAPSAPAPAPGSLDLSGPTPSPTPTPARPAAAGSSSLDLSGDADPAAPAAPAAPATPRSSGPISFARPSDSLDLSDAPAPPAAAAPARPAAPSARIRPVQRVRAGEQRLLDIKDPTVTLTRVQSGVGQLSIEAVCSPELGDLRLGAAYQLRGGGSSTVQLVGGNRFAPSSRRPVIVAGRDEYEHLRVDLRQTPQLERLAVYAFSESRTELTWGGTLVVTTFGGARIELPLETLYAGKVAVLLSIYNLDGELVVRAEMETVTGDVREAARAYGYDRITWRDDRTPVD